MAKAKMVDINSLTLDDLKVLMDLKEKELEKKQFHEKKKTAILRHDIFFCSHIYEIIWDCGIDTDEEYITRTQFDKLIKRLTELKPDMKKDTKLTSYDDSWAANEMDIADCKYIDVHNQEDQRKYLKQIKFETGE